MADETQPPDGEAGAGAVAGPELGGGVRGASAKAADGAPGPDGTGGPGAADAGSRLAEEQDHDLDGADRDGEQDDDFEDDEDEDLAPRRAPWHFKIILVGSVIYLGYRSYQGIAWLVHHG